MQLFSNVLTKCAQLGIFHSVVFAFDPEKNNLLREKRKVTFPMVIEAIAEKGILAHFQGRRYWSLNWKGMRTVCRMSLMGMYGS